VTTYVDDLLVSGLTEASTAAAMGIVKRQLRLAGLEDKEEKEVPPARRVVFLGVVIDLDTRTLSLQPLKLQELQQAVEQLCAFRESETGGSTVQELRSVTGKLTWAANVVPVGGAYLPPLWSNIAKISASHLRKGSKHQVQLTAEAGEALDWCALAGG